VELYHSATPWRGAAYRDLVLARWAEAGLTQQHGLSLSAAAPALAAGAAAMPLPPVQVVVVARAATGPRASVRVHYPSGMASADPAAPPLPARTGRLPRVIVPSIYAAR
jgi:hypothetical protein